MRTPFTPSIARRPVPVRRTSNSGVAMMVAGVICLAIGLSVLAYSAHRWRLSERRLAASMALLEASGRELEATRRLAIEVDQWIVDGAK